MNLTKALGTRVAVLLVGVSGLWIYFQDLPFFVRNIPDDGFYYLVVARNLAAGLGPTFDGITVTNGFHPLLATILAALYRFTPFSHLGDIRTAIALGMVLHLLTGWLLVLAVARAGVRRHAYLAGLLYWFNPYAFLRSFGAMEPPLYAFCLALLVYLMVRLGPELRGVQPTWTRSLLLGLAAGATLLARTDAIFLAPLLIFFFLPRSGIRPLPWKALFAFGLGASLFVLPWVLYSLNHFGTLLQYSGLMKSHTRWESLAGMNLLPALQVIAANLWVWTRKSIMTAPLMKYVLILILLGGARRHHLKRWIRSFPSGIQILLLFVVLLGCYYSVNYTLIRGWYLIPASVLGSFLSVHALRRCAPARRSLHAPKVRYLLAVLLLAEIILYPAVKLGRGIQREQVDTYAMVRWAADHADPGKRIGSFNAGIPAFFLENPVINLDGLMNNDMLEVFRERSLGAYLEEKRVRYILDHEGMLGPIQALAGIDWAREHLREAHAIEGREKGRRLILWELH